ncbi:hypothetical protein ACFLZI_02625 [Nitrospirota bacterium]
MRIKSEGVLYILFWTLALEGTAQAYIDPGTGGAFYQVLILIIGAIVGYFALFRDYLKRMFRKKRPDKDNPDE